MPIIGMIFDYPPVTRGNARSDLFKTAVDIHSFCFYKIEIGKSYTVTRQFIMREKEEEDKCTQLYMKGLSQSFVVLEDAVDASLYLYTIHRQLIIIMDRVSITL